MGRVLVHEETTRSGQRTERRYDEGPKGGTARRGQALVRAEDGSTRSHSLVSRSGLPRPKAKRATVPGSLAQTRRLIEQMRGF